MSHAPPRSSRLRLAAGCWLLVLLTLPFLGPPGRQVAVVGNYGTAARAITASGGRIVEMRRGATLARGDNPGFVRRLYPIGAPAVIEGRLAAGCFAKKGA